MLNTGKPWVALAYVLAAGLVVYLGYFVERETAEFLLPGFGLLFLACFYIIRQTEDDASIDLAYYWGMLLRVLLLFALPALSDDFYRFIWDGRLLLNFEDPYKALPEEMLNQGLTGIDQSLFDALNSKPYYSIYPPLNQLIFFISALFSPNSIFWSTVMLKIIILLFEWGNLKSIRRLLTHYGLPQSYGLLYILNPLAILELAGNLHFEAIVIFFLLQAILWYEQKKLHRSALFFGLAVATKFVPLIALPLLLRKLGWKKTLIYGLIVAATLVITFLPLINTDHIWAIGDSMKLYFQRFEFNGSIYYLARWYGFETKGHNIIATSGQWMLYLTLGSILLYSFLAQPKGRWAGQMVWVWALYLLFATTVHPWYLLPMLAMSVFSRYRFVYFWSFMIFFTYLNYAGDTYTDRIDVVILEYGIIGLIVILEMFGLKIQHFLSPKDELPF